MFSSENTVLVIHVFGQKTLCKWQTFLNGERKHILSILIDNTVT